MKTIVFKKTIIKMANGLLHLEQLAALEDAEEAVFVMEDRFHISGDPFLISDVKFIKIFRLNKVLTRNLIDELSEFMVPPARSSALTIEKRVSYIPLYTCQ
jgi:hypothetical protein